MTLTLTLTVDLRDVRLAGEIISDDRYFNALSRPYPDVWTMETANADRIADMRDALDSVLGTAGLNYELTIT